MDIVQIICEWEWNAIVWEYIANHSDDYDPQDDYDFVRAETDIIYRDCTPAEDEHLRQLDIL